MASKAHKRGILARASRYAVRKPWKVMAVWAVVAVSMGIAGMDIQDKLSAGDTTVSGLNADKAKKIKSERFKGQDESLAFMLSGRGDLKRYGRRAVKEVGSIKGVKSILSPFSPNAPKELTSRNGDLLFLVVTDRSFEEAGERIVPQVRTTLKRTLPKRIDFYVTSASGIGAEYTVLAQSNAKEAEKIAAPLLLIILLLVFRSPIAALVPLIIGASVIVIGTGLFAIATEFTAVHGHGMAGLSFMGLALGVDYSMLMVFRFRDELAEGYDVKDAVARSLLTAGETIKPAGLIVAISGAMTLLLIPKNNIILSMFAAISVASILSIVVAVTVIPAVLAILGARINKWSIGRQTARSKVVALVSRIIKRPVLVCIVILVPLLIMSSLSLALPTEPADPRALPEESLERQSYLAVVGRYRASLADPVEVIVTSKSGPLTDYQTLKQLEVFQSVLKQNPEVAMVLGPTGLAGPAEDLSKEASKGRARFATFSEGLGKASDGIESLRQGMVGAQSASSALAQGNGEALAGSSELAAGSTRLSGSMETLSEGLGKASEGAGDLHSGVAKLRNAAAKASQGARDISSPLAAFKEDLRSSAAEISNLKQAPSTALSALESAKAALESFEVASKSDSNYSRAYEQVATAYGAISGLDLSSNRVEQNYYGMEAALSKIEAQSQQSVNLASEISNGATTLSNGLDALSAGNSSALKGAASLDGALSKAQSGTNTLLSGSNAVASGNSALSSGIAQLQAGSSQLDDAISQGYDQSLPLQSGLDQLNSGVQDTNRKLSNSTITKDIDSEAIATSGNLTLAAIDGLPQSMQDPLSLVLNTESGGNTAIMYVFYKPDLERNTREEFLPYIENQSDQLAKGSGKDVTLGGQGMGIEEFDDTTESRKPLLIGLIAFFSFLFMVAVFRSLLLALKAVILNLLVVGTALEVLNLAISGNNLLLDGTGWIDVAIFYVIYAVTFALSMDYEIFMINRMREGYLKSKDNDLAISYGLAHTARVITGAAFIMAAVFVSFALTGFTVTQHMGIALTAAILIDATIVRLVLLPATMRIFGRANWWIPKWLDRILPKLSVETPAGR